MKYGLTELQLNEIITFLEKFPAIEKATIFGSRAIGNYKEASDIDIVLMGQKVNNVLAAHIQYEIQEETYLPYFFDIIAYNEIDNEALRKHIADHGKVIYQR